MKTQLLLNVTLGLVFLLGGMLTVSAQQKSIFDLMHHSDELAVTLESDFEYLKTNRRSEEYQKARIFFEDATGTEQAWNLKVRLRGNFRRLFCTEIPPLKLKFKKSELAVAGLAEFNDMKLVTYCTSNRQEAYELLMKEFLAYELYNELSDNSYRVQLLNITYKDTNTGKKTRQWGFLIEDTAQLRHRMGGAEKIENVYNLPAERFSVKDRKLVALFEYIIGNSDWSYTMGKNVKLLEKNGKIIPVPYDFDFSGMVSAPYAVPNPNYVIFSLTERIFMGFPQDLEDLHDTVYQVYGVRQVLLNKVKSFNRLNSEKRREVANYLTSYFEDFENIRLGVQKERKVITIADSISE